MHCPEFEAVLSEALDQTLTGAKLDSFRSHARVCPNCGPLFAAADAGRRWLKSLEEVEPPADLVRNILAATQPQVSWSQRLREWAGMFVSPLFAAVRQPRFAMSFGMAFFSLSIALSVAGVKLSDLRHVDLRPSALRRNYYTTTGRVVKYYENIRFVYEIESRVREFKRATTPAEPSRREKEKEHKNNTSGQPEERQERNSSREENQPVLALAPDDPPVVTVATNRRMA